MIPAPLQRWKAPAMWTGTLLPLLAVLGLMAYAAGIGASPTINHTDVPCGETSALTAAFNAANESADLDIIKLAAGCTYSLKFTADFTFMAGLPAVSSPISLIGNNATIQRDPNEIGGLRLLAVTGEGQLNLDSVNLSGGRALQLNQIDKGAALFNWGGTATIFNSTLSDNFAIWGGAIYNASGGTLEVRNSTLAGNLGKTDGGAIDNLGTATLVSTTISGNTMSPYVINGSTYGGGISSSGELTLSNVTLWGNSATEGAGLFNNSIGIITVKNSIIAGNLGGDDCDVSSPFSESSGGSFTASGVNLDSDGSCPGFTITSDPLLGPLQDNGGPTPTLALLPGGPAIDAALDCSDLNGASVSDDQRGVSRPQGPACDLGAFEVEAEQEAAQAFDLLAFLSRQGLEYIDYRPRGGALWVLGGRELADMMQDLESRGITFTFASRGARETGYESAWSTTYGS